MFWIRPETFQALLLDIFEAMRRRGFRLIVVVTGHWSSRVYLPTLRAAGAEFKDEHPDVGCLYSFTENLSPWQRLPAATRGRR
jgi:creatinine amidohydrolase/Fe(II)-dependent formamide hydrolase-like protein